MLSFRAALLVGCASVLLAAQPPEVEVYSPLGKVFYSLSDKERRIEAADVEVAKHPGDPDILLAAAAVREKFLRFADAVPIYTRGMNEFPNDARFPRLRGARYLITRRFDAALSDLKLAVQMAPASYEGAYYMGLAYFLHGDFNHAAREFARCLDMDPLPRPELLHGLPAPQPSCYSMPEAHKSGMSEWLYISLRRGGKADEASARAPQHRSSSEYSSAMEAWSSGSRETACEGLAKILEQNDWSDVDFLAAEADIARGLCRPNKNSKR